MSAALVADDGAMLRMSPVLLALVLFACALGLSPTSRACVHPGKAAAAEVVDMYGFGGR